MKSDQSVLWPRSCSPAMRRGVTAVLRDCSHRRMPRNRFARTCGRARSLSRLAWHTRATSGRRTYAAAASPAGPACLNASANGRPNTNE